MTEKLQVVARFKSADTSNPRFTRTASLEELMVELMKTLPVDLVYYVIPHEDGAGYSLREAGVIVLDLFNHKEVQPALEDTQQSSSLPFPSSLAVLQEEQMDNPVVAVTKETQSVQVSMPFVSPPKSQTELLAERGIVEPKVNLSPKKSKKLSKADKLSAKAERDFQTQLGLLPNPVSNGKVKVTRISQATQAEAAAASSNGLKLSN